MVSALWALDYLSELSKAGVRLLNVHGGPDVVYTPIGFGGDGGLQVRPLYYALRLFAELTANSSVWLRSDGEFDGRWHATPAVYGGDGWHQKTKSPVSIPDFSSARPWS